jgi:hypothetical protein
MYGATPHSDKYCQHGEAEEIREASVRSDLYLNSFTAHPASTVSMVINFGFCTRLGSLTAERLSPSEVRLCSVALVNRIVPWFIWLYFSGLLVMLRRMAGWITEVPAEWLSILIPVQEIQDSNLGLKTTILTESCRGFPQSLQTDARIVP